MFFLEFVLGQNLVDNAIEHADLLEGINIEELKRIKSATKSCLIERGNFEDGLAQKIAKPTDIEPHNSRVL